MRLSLFVLLLSISSVNTPAQTEDRFSKNRIFTQSSDRDGDSIPDAQDNCPEVAGIKEYKGCPEGPIGTLFIQTIPPNADVKIDNQKQQSPARFQLKEGTYKYIISLSGYRETSNIYHFTGNIADTLSFELSRIDNHLGTNQNGNSDSQYIHPISTGDSENSTQTEWLTQ